MVSAWSLLGLAHLVGLALGLGAATVKLTLLLRCRADQAFTPIFLEVARPITRLIILGLILLTASGIGWVMLDYPLRPLLWAKLFLVVVLWGLGPFIDNVAEPRFRAVATAADAPAAELRLAWEQYLMVEITATVVFYAITVMGAML